jgi:hypothetical protein
MSLLGSARSPRIFVSFFEKATSIEQWTFPPTVPDFSIDFLGCRFDVSQLKPLLDREGTYYV